MGAPPVHQPGRPSAASAGRTALGRAALIAGALSVGLLAGCERIDVARGAAAYETHCVVCHGREGRGLNAARPYGSIAPEQEGWIAPALDTRGHCYLHTRAQLFSIIRDGSPFPGSPMIPFKGKLTDGQIRALIAYLVSLWDVNTRREYEAREQLFEQMRRRAG